ncbi:hypothetical protein P6144_00790 [Sphingomonas sp. HITSZ_GF]|uniref:hypothetical protein n=1 Tax=Sphingomonas sp. HITSZ_GF TaxID=3037247 RepID=UPI00240DAF81|nr:hypothetical protein [Sphingomonas sp. HITSZ_GF]MDG2532171.1 hypothetical protein [Sphingomonas sp. HITSZ_GF]
MPVFTDFIAIDWSGQAVERPKGLAVACAQAGTGAPELVERNWSRQDIADWLGDLADSGTRALIGLDLSPAFPLVDQGAYFPGWNQSPPDGPALWALVEELSAEDPHLAATSFVSHPEARRHFRQMGDCGDLFPPGRGRFRVCEHGQAAMQLSPYSCFNLVGASQVGKSSLTGMRVLHLLRGQVPIWPFDPLPEAGPVLVEIYTSLAARTAGMRKGISKIRDGATLDAMLAALGSKPHAPLARYDDHATDAMLSAAWLRAVADDPGLWAPEGLTPELARTEGWTFGVR